MVGPWGGRGVQKNRDSARSRRSFGKTGDYGESRIELDVSSFFRILTLSLIDSLMAEE